MSNKFTPWTDEQAEKIAERIKSKIKVQSSGCWVWQGATDNKGYGQIRVRKGTHLAHRISYFIFTGINPEGKHCCHKCDNPPCVNPAHIFLGNMKDNIIDSVQKRRHYNSKLTHCRKGHELSGDNLSYQKTKGGGVERRCKACSNARSRGYNKKPERLAYQREYQRRVRAKAKLVGVREVFDVLE